MFDARDCGSKVEIAARKRGVSVSCARAQHAQQFAAACVSNTRMFRFVGRLGHTHTDDILLITVVTSFRGADAENVTAAGGGMRCEPAESWRASRKGREPKARIKFAGQCRVAKFERAVKEGKSVLRDIWESLILELIPDSDCLSMYF